jgi:2-methylcitrate dehydratase PrpD
VATALFGGKVTLADFTSAAINRENIREIAAKVSAEFDDKMTRHGVGPGKVTIIMNNGAEYSMHVEHCLGSIENPMNFEDCAHKFRECAANSRKPIEADEVEKVIGLSGRLEQLDDATEIIRLLG